MASPKLIDNSVNRLGQQPHGPKRGMGILREIVKVWGIWKCVGIAMASTASNFINAWEVFSLKGFRAAKETFLS